MEQEDNYPKWDDWFYYDEKSPSCLRWKVSRLSGRHMKNEASSCGAPAGSMNTDGYWRVKLQQRRFQVHRVIYELMKGRLGDLLVDHLNGDPSDNRIDNLRAVPLEMNMRNTKIPSDNKSGVVGVGFYSNRKGCRYWCSVWHNLDGKQQQKSFSVNKYGNDEAFLLACEYRTKMIEELNALGAGYTERHGK